MTDIEITLNAWEQNYVQVLAVQGESEGRTIIATLIDRAGQTDTTFNAESIDRPINLTGVTARLYCIKPDGTKSFSDGTVTDATNGVASFILPYQATAASGDVECQILLTKADNSTLKTIGLHLDVQASDLEGAAESTDEFSSLVTALNRVDSAVTDAEEAVENAQSALITAQEAASTANEAAESARNLPRIADDGYWELYNSSTNQYEKTDVPASAVYAVFDIDPSAGLLHMTTTDTYTQPTFAINAAGELEVAYA